MKGEERGDDLLPRERIGDYRVVDVLGRGGMGIVYLAEASDGSEVALKMLQTGPIRSRSERARFEREARIRIEHPNIVRIVDAGIDGDIPWIAFERLAGMTLSERQELSRPTVEEAVHVAIEATKALVAAHERAVIHRDIKPSNIFLCGDGGVKLIDFGVAAVHTEETRLTATGNVLGTPTYLSPEQANGSRAVDARTDVWSLGVVLYEMLAGRSPFERTTALATVLAVMVEQAPSLTLVAPHVPRSLAAIVHRCLEKKPEDRFESARALLSALEHVNLTEARATPMEALSVAKTSPSLPPVSTPSIAPGETRVVAVLLADGVTEHLLLSRAVEEAGGSLIPIVGDRAIGLFGGEAWEGDELERAARAALEARHTARYVSIASGRAAYSGATGIAGSALVAAEQACAARLEGVAADATSARALSMLFTVRDAGNGIYEILDRSSGSISTLPPPPRRRTIGREGEIAQIASAMGTVRRDARGAVLLVTGPPGIGKSHLRWELGHLLEEEADEHDEEPFVVLAGRGDPARRGVGLGLFEDLLTAFAAQSADRHGWPRLHRSASPEERSEAVRRLVQEAIDPGPEAEECAAFFGVLLKADVRASVSLEAARHDGQLMQDRLRLAIVDWLGALAARGPVALLLEDLHWADDASIALVDEIVEQLADAPILVFLTARPQLVEEHPELLAGASSTKISLGGLRSSQVEELVSMIAPGKQVSRELVEALAERTAGNPLFVEQIVLALRDEDRLDGDLGDLPLPLTVEAAVQSRLDHLPSAEKDLCKRAALFERAFTPGDLESLGLFDLKTLLASLTRRDILASRARAGAGTTRAREYRFRSSLVRDVAYRMMAPGLRDDLHLRLAEHLCKGAAPDPEEVAIHFERGGQRTDAAEWYARATAAVARLGDAPRALRCADKALALGTPSAKWFELQMARSEALELLGRLDEQARALDAALATAQTDAERARARTDRAVWGLRAGRTEEAVELIARAVDEARRSGEAEVLATARGRQAAVLTYAGELDAAREALTEAEALARAELPRLLPLVAVWRAQLASARGDLGERRIAYRDAAEGYAKVGDVRRAAFAEVNLADVDNRVGAYAEAEHSLHDALDKCRRLGNRLMEGYALANLGYAELRQHRIDEALATLEQAALSAEAVGEMRLGLTVRVYAARAREARDPARALEDALAAATEAGTRGLAAVRVLGLGVAARLALAAADTTRALELSSAALALRDELGSVEEDEAELFVVRARALEAAGRAEEAHAIRARGRARVEEIAQQISEDSYRRRFLEDVSAHSELLEG